MDTKTLIDELSRRLEIDKKQAAAMLESTCLSIQNICSSSGAVAIPGFGTLEPKRRPERVMCVPSTGRRLLLPPKVSMVFRPSAILKNLLRESDKV